MVRKYRISNIQWDEDDFVGQNRLELQLPPDTVIEITDKDILLAPDEYNEMEIIAKKILDRYSYLPNWFDVELLEMKSGK